MQNVLKSQNKLKMTFHLKIGLVLTKLWLFEVGQTLNLPTLKIKVSQFLHIYGSGS